MHPVHISAQRIDLAVMRDVTIRMRALPAGKCVRRKTLMYQTESADYIWIGKLAVEVRELGGQHQSFVDDGSTRKRGDVKRARTLIARFAYFAFGALTHDVQLSLESVFIKTRRPSDKNLLDIWLRGSRDATNCRSEDRHISPAQYGQTLLANNSLKNPFALQPGVLLHGQERHADPVRTGQR